MIVAGMVIVGGALLFGANMSNSMEVASCVFLMSIAVNIDKIRKRSEK
jgi:hypothetical protein